MSARTCRGCGATEGEEKPVKLLRGKPVVMTIQLRPAWVLDYGEWLLCQGCLARLRREDQKIRDRHLRIEAPRRTA